MFGKKKVDGVLEAAHYGDDGLVAWVRIFERRGAIWSDRVRLDRNTFIARLEAGEKFVSGKRIPFHAAEFEFGEAVTVVEKNGHTYLVSGMDDGHTDSLAQVPLV